MKYCDMIHNFRGCVSLYLPDLFACCAQVCSIPRSLGGQGKLDSKRTETTLHQGIRPNTVHRYECSGHIVRFHVKRGCKISAEQEPQASAGGDTGACPYVVLLWFDPDGCEKMHVGYMMPSGAFGYWILMHFS